jgi:hypothetical protein
MFKGLPQRKTLARKKIKYIIMGVYWIGTLVKLTKNVYGVINAAATKEKEDTIAAHMAVNSAFIKTYHYAKNLGEGNKPNPELAEAWNEASAAVMKIDSSLGEELYSKSRFWLDPNLYLNLGRDGEIIELKEIVDEMEKMRMKLK